MTWLENFYLSENIKDDRKAVKKRINRKKDVLEYYLLTVSKLNEGIVDIMPALELDTCPKRKKDSMTIIGVSNGYHNAKALIESMDVEHCYDLIKD